MSTATEAELFQKAQAVEPGSFRQTVLLAAKRFKSTWAELGRLLVKVRDEALFEQWGYPTFEAYCLKEIHIRKATAEKLTRSFAFLARHEPKVASSEDLVQRAPPFEVVEVLARADERGQLSAAEYKAIRDSIWESKRPSSELRRELEERFPRPVPADSAAQEAQRLRRLATGARQLANDLLACRKVPRAVADRAFALAGDLEALLERERGPAER